METHFKMNNNINNNKRMIYVAKFSNLYLPNRSGYLLVSEACFSSVKFHGVFTILKCFLFSKKKMAVRAYRPYASVTACTLTLSF